MAIYGIADLHLSFGENKPMNIFGENWENHFLKIKKNWEEKVKQEDTVIMPGDFSWSMYIQNAKKDFEYIDKLPGKKILLKGNHDYWWTTLSKMNQFIEENNFKNIHFLSNNSYLVENKVIVGTRGWNVQEIEENIKMINREINRLKLSIEDGINKFGRDKEFIAFLHYPPITQNTLNNRKIDFIKILNDYNIKRCYYGHLHGKAHQDAVEGIVNGIDFKLISSDYLNFDLLKIN